MSCRSDRVISSFYFSTRNTRSGTKKKEISPSTAGTSSSGGSATKRLKTLSNPEDDLSSQTTQDKPLTTAPTSDSSEKDGHVSGFSITPVISKNNRSISENFAATPLSTKKRISKTRNSAKKSLKSVDHNKQYVIDAGQKDFDGLKSCDDCGMVYTRGVKEDELHHQKFHDSVLGSSEIKSSPLITTPAKLSKGINIVSTPKSLSLKLKSLKWSFNSKTMKERVLEWIQLPCLNNTSSGRIIGFTSDELLKNEKLLNLVDKYFKKAGQEIGIESGIMEYNQLFLHIPNRSPSIFLLMIVSEKKTGATPRDAATPNNRVTPKNAVTPKNVVTSKASASKGTTPKSSSTPSNDLSNKGDYVIGLVSCESINTAERLISENPLSCSTNENNPAKIGVSRLWVSSAFRRRNVASHLLDALRRHFMTMTANTSQVVAKDLVAFSDPTESGLRFAQKYFNRKDILVFSLFHSLTPAAIEEL